MRYSVAEKQVPTATLAKLLIAQGYYEDAQRVYEELLEAEPDNAEWRKALERVREKAEALRLDHAAQPSPRLIALTQKWIRLRFRASYLFQLQALAGELARKRR